MCQNLKEARKKRAAARGWVTHHLKELQDLIKDDTTSFELLEAAVSVYDQRVATFSELQSQVELLLEPDDLEADMDDADKFLRDARKIRAQAAKCLKAAIDGSDKTSTSSKKRSEVKLPRLKLPKFSGELTEWQSFWDRFEALVDQSELPDISKFSYLQSLLQGEALSVIQGLALSSANYKVACDLLKERFGCPERIIFAHVQGLLNVSLPPRAKGANQCESLWKLQDQLLCHVRSLEGLGISGDQYGVVLTPVILSRLPQDIRLEWSRESSGHEDDLEWLLKFLQLEIQRQERSETFKHVTLEKNTARQEVERRKMESHEKVEPCQCPEEFGEVLPREMYLAAKHGKLKKIRQYLEKGHDVNACDEDSCSLLASACIAGRLEVVRFLHKIPQLHRNVTDWSGDTPIMHAARMGHKDVVKELLTRPHPCRLNVDIMNSYEDKAVNIAIASSNSDIAELIQGTKLPKLQWHPELCQVMVPVRTPAAEVTFECSVCMDEYNTKERRPRALSCGHSLCTSCITLLLQTGNLVCALCRNVHIKKVNRATDIPVNFAIDEILQQKEQSS